MKKKNWSLRNGMAALILTIIALILILPAVPAYATTVGLTTRAQQPVGNEFRVDIVVDNVTTDLYGLAADLVYDAQYMEVVDVDAAPENGVQPKVTEGALLNRNGLDETFLRSALEDGIPGALVLGLSRSGSTAGVSASADTVILSVYFRGLKGGTTTIAFSAQALKDSANEDITVSAWNGVTVVLGACVNGDVNYDGYANILDAILTLRIILGSEPVPESLCPVDLDNSGSIDIVDLIRILRVSLE